MSSIKTILSRFVPDDTTATVQAKAVTAIGNCRSGYYGMALYRCGHCCGHHRIYRSCGNRHCPNCQHLRQHRWLNNRIEHQLPAHHFMLTFTVPEQLRRFVYRHQRPAYDALFKASADTIKKLAKDPKYIGGDLPGFFGILHTWGQLLQYHPHIHYVVAGGAFNNSSGTWNRSRLDFLLPVKAMSKMFKAKFKDRMLAAGLLDRIPRTAWNKGFNVHCKPVGNGHKSLSYLAKYLFKVAITGRRIVKVADDRVFFKYRVKNSNRYRTTSLDTDLFIARFLQHVLPTGFVKVRYFGLYHPNCTVDHDKLGALIMLAYAFEVPLTKTAMAPEPVFRCPHCKTGTLALAYLILPATPLQGGYG